MKPDLDDEKTCPKCHMPLEKKGSGSLTQWIKVCNCGRPDAEKTVGAPINICTTCGKRIEAGRAGTLTQWIFRADLCTCEVPTWAKERMQAAGDALSADAVEEQDELADLEELPMDPGSFPVDRYGPIRCVGMGASGKVYLCKDRLLNKKVAVKVLNNLSSEQLVAFQREAKATSQIEHPNIVKVLDFGVCDGKYPYMVLEYIDGLSLEQVLEERQTLDLEEALPIFDQVCAALSFAHNRSLFHRDLKPTNIIVVGWESADVGARLIDFGVGVFKQETTAQGRSVAGSPAYMCPDQALGLPFDARSEVYSFGCVMFHVLTGAPPFLGETALETISLHAHAEPPSLSDANGSVIFSDAIEAVIAKCLSKAPKDRYKNMTELKNALAETVSDYHRDDRRLTEPLPDSKSSSAKQWAILSIVAAAVCTVLGVIVVQSQLIEKKETVHVTPKKPAYKEPELGDALDTIEQDAWYKGVDGYGETVWTSGPNLEDKDFELLKEEKDVRKITVGLTDAVTGTGFKYLSDKGIEEITIKSTGLNDDGLREICKIKTLQTLRMSVTSRLTLEGVKCITTLPELWAIDMTVMQIPDGTIETVSTIPTLQSLSLYNTKNVKLADLHYLSALKDLEYLDLTGTGVSNDVFPILAKFKSLSNLRIANLDLTDENLELLGKLPNLSDLWLADNPRITDKGLNKLSNCKQLQSLVLEHCPGITKIAKAKFNKQNPEVVLRSVSDTGVRLMDSMESLDRE